MPLVAGLVASVVVAALLPWPGNAFVLAVLVVCGGLAFGTFFTPGMTLLTHLAEARGLDYGYALRADQPRVGARADARRGRGRRARARDARRRALPRARGVCALTLAAARRAGRRAAT